MPNYNGPADAPWYNDQKQIKKVVIENGVTSIGQSALWNCTSLTSITIPNSVTSIGDRAFYLCESLTSITIPNSVTSIGTLAFYGCSGLTSITIPNSVRSIGNVAFIGCSGLTSITVEKGNTKYDSRDNCNAIIETNTNMLIAGCKITTIPNSVTSIEGDAFHGCSGLTSITIPNSVTSIGMQAFFECSSLTSITIPNSVTSIKSYTFRGCSGLTSITIPNSVTSIGMQAFFECSSLTSVTIPNSVTSIGDDAFGECSSLTSITIPNSVTSIGERAFDGCSGLTSITFERTTPPQIEYAVFDGVNKSIPIYVPANSREAYKKALGGFGLSNIKVAPLFLKDGEAYTQDSQIDGMDIYYTRSFANTNWQALYLPFSLNYEDWKDDFEVARINGIHQYDDNDDGNIDRTILEFVKMTNDDSVIYPNTPYLIRAKTPGEKTLSIENTTVYESKANSIECSTTTELFTFIGTYKVMNFSGIGAYHNCYVLGSTGRNIIEGKTFLPPYRWYMKMKERDSVYGIKNNTAKEISIRVVGEEATGIANIQHTSPNTQTYDLNGRKVNENNLKPGIYVKNGRKFVIK